jgi:hypothetical protein
MKIQCEWIFGRTRCERIATHFWWRPNNGNLYIAGCKTCSDISMYTSEMKKVGWKLVSAEEYILYKILAS